MTTPNERVDAAQNQWFDSWIYLPNTVLVGYTVDEAFVGECRMRALKRAFVAWLGLSNEFKQIKEARSKLEYLFKDKKGKVKKIKKLGSAKNKKLKFTF